MAPSSSAAKKSDASGKVNACINLKTSKCSSIVLTQPKEVPCKTGAEHEEEKLSQTERNELDDASYTTSIDDDDDTHDKRESAQIVHYCKDATASEGSHIFNGDAGLRTMLTSRRHDFVRSQAIHHSSILNGDIGIEEYLILTSSLRQASRGK